MPPERGDPARRCPARAASHRATGARVGRVFAAHAPHPRGQRSAAGAARRSAFSISANIEASLIGQQIESLQTQGEIFAAALGEGAVLDSVDEGEILLPDLARQMMRRLVEPTRTRARLFDVQGRHDRRQPDPARPGRRRCRSSNCSRRSEEAAVCASPIRSTTGLLDAAAAAHKLSGLPRKRLAARRGLCRRRAGLARRDRLGGAAATRRPAAW